MKSLFLLLFVFCSVANAEVTLEGNPTLKFTGYKFLDKTPVSGTFKSIQWDAKKKAESVEELLRSAVVKIDSYTVDAGNAARNTNIKSALFRKWGGQNIEGKVKKIDSKSEYVVVEMQVGSKTKELIFQYSLKGKDLILTSSIDLIALGFGEAFASLAKKCAGLHKGKDGVIKTWSVVDLEIIAKLK